jgi:hypothetical protein
MAVEFKKFTRDENGSLNDLGTLKEIAGKKGKIALIRKNFNDPSKRVAVLVTNAKGESAVIACSAQVSKALRDKQMNIAQLAGLSVVENDEGHNFVSMPATGGVQEFVVDTIKTAEVEVSGEFLPEELVAF